MRQLTEQAGIGIIFSCFTLFSFGVAIGSSICLNKYRDEERAFILFLALSIISFISGAVNTAGAIKYCNRTRGGNFFKPKQREKISLLNPSCNTDFTPL